MQPKNMLTPHDFKLIEDLFDKKFEENAQSIIAAVNTIIDPMAKDVHILKKDVAVLKSDVSTLKVDVRVIKKQIGLVNERLTTDQKRMDIYEERLRAKGL